MQTRDYTFPDALVCELADPRRGDKVPIPMAGTSLPCQLLIKSIFGADLNFQRFRVTVDEQRSPGTILAIEGGVQAGIELAVNSSLGETSQLFHIHRTREAGFLPVVLIITPVTQPDAFVPLRMTIPVMGAPPDVREAEPETKHVLLSGESPTAAEIERVKMRDLQPTSGLPHPIRHDEMVPIDDTDKVVAIQETPPKRNQSLAIGPLRFYLAHRELIIHRSNVWNWRMKRPSFTWTIDHSLAAALALLALSIALTWPSWLQIYQILSY